MKKVIYLGLILIGHYSFATSCGGYEMVNSTQTVLVAPPVPVYENCERTSTDHDGNPVVIMDQACLARNQQKARDYQFQSSCFSTASQAQQAAAAAQTAEQLRLAEQAKLNSAKAAAESAQNKNKDGSMIYQMASIGCAAYSAMKFAEFASTPCPGTPVIPGFCSPPPLITSIAFAALAVLASKQASSHDQVAYNACQAAGQLASDGGNCGGAPPPYNPQSFPSNLTGTGPGTIGSIFDQNGKCIGSPSQCQSIISNLPPGTNIKEGIKGLNSFITNGSKAFKVDKDGNIVTKDGKKYNADSFANEKAMMAAGLSAAQAKSLMSDLNRAGAGFNAAAALAKENSGKGENGGAFGENGAAGGAGGKGSGITANGGANSGKDLAGSKRDPASAEGLAKEFNGDMIGVAGDDIFKMMNRRYKLKASQDNFIAP